MFYESVLSTQVVVTLVRSLKSSSFPISCMSLCGLQDTPEAARLICPALASTPLPVRFACFLAPTQLFIILLAAMRNYNHDIRIIMQTTLFLLLLVAVSCCPDNCLYCQQPSQCSACLSSYGLTINATCTNKTVVNCRVYKNATACLICEPTFKVSSGKCMKDYSGCILRRATGECQFCSFGTRLKGSQCTGILNCKVQGSTGICSECSRGYVLSFGGCKENRSECLNASAGVCFECRPKYVINGFTCYPQIVVPQQCSLFDNANGRCLICNMGYQMYMGSCQRVDQIRLQRPSAKTNSILPQDDFLSNGGDRVSNARPVDADSLFRNYKDIQIDVVVGSGNVNVKETCWQPSRTGSGCLVCKQGFINIKGNCVPASPQCLKYDQTRKKCLQCAPILTKQNNSCVDINCAVAAFSRCNICKNLNYQPNNQGICVNAYCMTMIAGFCTQCSKGFTLSPTKMCINSSASASLPQNSLENTPNSLVTPPNIPQTPKPSTPPVPSTPTSPAATKTMKGCDVANGNVCLRCSEKYYPDSNGQCQRVVIGCLQMDTKTQMCTQCMSGYDSTTDGDCLYNQNPVIEVVADQKKVIPTAPVNSIVKAITNTSSTTSASSFAIQQGVDPNCLVPNIESCGVCKDRYILNLFNFTCMKVPAECATYNPITGTCITCTTGTILFESFCLPRTSKPDPNCNIHDMNNYCSSCKQSYYKSRGQCFLVNSQCKTFNQTGGECLSCYSGYALINGLCILLSQQPACQSYDFQGNCEQCVNRYYLLGAICTPINPLCGHYNNITGVCLDCISGYGLSSVTQQCQVIKAPPLNCLNADPIGLCLSCIVRFYVDPLNNACLPVPALCQNYAPVGGKCSACITGYKLLADQSCVKNSFSLGCISADAQGRCSSCLFQYVLTQQGSCQPKDPYCTSYVNGVCTNCNSVYYLSAAGVCTKKVMKEKDPNCAIHDLFNFCQRCTQGFYTSAGNCFLADQLCKTFDPTNGNCLSCYDGYRLNKNRCYLNDPIFNCKMFAGSVCAQCETGYVLGADGSCSQK